MNDRDIFRKQFMGDRCLRYYVVPEGAREIGDYAFANCRKLEWVAIPVGVERYGREIFAGCEKLREVYLYREVEKEELCREDGASELQPVDGTEEVQFANGANGVYPEDGINILHPSNGVGAMLQGKRAEGSCMEGEFLAAAFRFFPNAGEIAMAFGRSCAEGMRAWDSAFSSFLNRPQEEGFRPFLAGGEEDYEDEGEALREHCRRKRKIWAELLLQRLKADFLSQGTEYLLRDVERSAFQGEACRLRDVERSVFQGDVYRLRDVERSVFQARLRENDMALEALKANRDADARAAEVCFAAGVLTGEAIRRLLKELPQERVELRAALMRLGMEGTDDWDGWEL